MTYPIPKTGFPTRCPKSNS